MKRPSPAIISAMFWLVGAWLGGLGVGGVAEGSGFVGGAPCGRLRKEKSEEVSQIYEYDMNKQFCYTHKNVPLVALQSVREPEESAADS